MLTQVSLKINRFNILCKIASLFAQGCIDDFFFLNPHAGGG